MTWLVALRLGRVSNLPTVWTNALTGIVLAGQQVWHPRSLLIFIALSLFYVAGMYLNDAFDRDIDARERPERPIPSGRVTAATVFTAGFAMMALGLALLLWVGHGFSPGTGWAPFLAGSALGAAIVVYDGHHKNNPLSPLLMGVCRMLVYVTAGFAVAAQPPVSLYLAAVILLCYLIGLTYIAKQETLGSIRNLWPLVFLGIPFVCVLPFVGDSAAGLVLYAGMLLWVLYALYLLFRPGRTDVPGAVVSLIAGICLLDGLFIVGYGHPELAWLAVGGFALTLVFQRYIPGT